MNGFDNKLSLLYTELQVILFTIVVKIWNVIYPDKQTINRNLGDTERQLDEGWEC